MADSFGKFYAELDSPAGSAFVAGSSDANTFSQPTRALYVGTGGNVHVRMLKSQANVVFQNVPAGSILPIRIDTVWATSTTANGFIGLY